MSIQVKICGIRQIESAETALNAGAEFIGFNFYPPSSRHIKIYQAKKIIDKIGKKIQIVGIFRNQPLNEVIEIVTYLKLNVAQLHGRESADYAKQIPTAVIKAFSLPADFVIENVLTQMESYSSQYFLLDREIQGTGHMLNLDKVVEVIAAKKIFLAGGLNPDNIADILERVKPFGVDVASGIETNGTEDNHKINHFIQKVKSYVV